MNYKLASFVLLAIGLSPLPFISKQESTSSTLTVATGSYEIPDYDWDCLIEAFILQESNGNDTVVGDGGKALGCLQLHPIMVAEANRISNSSYTLEDRLSRSKSIEMFNIVQSHHNPYKDPALACKVWNPTAGEWYTKSVLNKYQTIYNNKYNKD